MYIYIYVYICIYMFVARAPNLLRTKHISIYIYIYFFFCCLFPFRCLLFLCVPPVLAEARSAISTQRKLAPRYACRHKIGSSLRDKYTKEYLQYIRTRNHFGSRSEARSGFLPLSLYRPQSCSDGCSMHGAGDEGANRIPTSPSACWG